ncbi:MAG: SGNH/GDSL hydrolase family protein [Kiritimatiellia bacterium]|jgi:lysophospholipase L1-like esterase
MKIHLIGDSISIHYGPYLERDLEGIMTYSRKNGAAEALLNLDKPQGANGGDSSMVAAYLKGCQRAGGIDSDLLLVNCGLHDIKTDPSTGEKQVPLDAYERNLREMLETVEAMRMRPRFIWIRTTPCDEAVHNSRPGIKFYRFAADCHAYNAAADRIMREAGVPSIDLHTFTQNLGPELYCDHVHFHDAVREKQAAFIAGWLQGFVVRS